VQRSCQEERHSAGQDSPADSAGSIPVTRSQAKRCFGGLARQSLRFSDCRPEQAIADECYAHHSENDGKPRSPPGSGIDFGFGGVAWIVDYRDLLSRLGNDAIAADSRLGPDIPAIESLEGQDRMADPAIAGGTRLPPQVDYGPGDTLACSVQVAVLMNAIAPGYNEHQANDEQKHHANQFSLTAPAAKAKVCKAERKRPILD
jgi:hypothetical protein